MRPSSTTSNIRQSASEALDLMIRAKEDNKSLEITKSGDVKITYHSQNQGKGNQIASKEAIYAVLKKMCNESRPLMGGGWGSEDLYISNLQEHIPSLKQFILEGKFQRLDKDWNAWIKNNYRPDLESASKIIEDRLNLIAEIKQLIPVGLIIKHEMNHVATMTHTYSEDRMNMMLSEFRKINNEILNLENDLNPQFLKDAGRCKYTFTANGKRNSIDNGNKDKVIDELKDFCNGNKVMTGTLSKLLCQTAVSPLIIAESEDIKWGEKGSLVNLIDKFFEPKIEFQLSFSSNDDIHLSFISLNKSRRIQDRDNGKIYRINQGPIFEGEPNQNNFTFRSSFSISLKQKDLEKGIINPTFNGPPNTTFCIGLFGDEVNPEK